MASNFGNAKLDKYGFYLFLGANLKDVEEEETKVWVSIHNPTKVGIDPNKKDFDVYIITKKRNAGDVTQPIKVGFKTRDAAKKWVNENWDNITK